MRAGLAVVVVVDDDSMRRHLVAYHRYALELANTVMIIPLSVVLLSLEGFVSAWNLHGAGCGTLLSLWALDGRREDISTPTRRCLAMKC